MKNFSKPFVGYLVWLAAHLLLMLITFAVAVQVVETAQRTSCRCVGPTTPSGTSTPAE